MSGARDEEDEHANAVEKASRAGLAI